MYRQYNERVGVSLEQGTPDVPPDTKYYLRRDGQTVSAFPSLKRAMTAYQKLVQEILQQGAGDSAGEALAPGKEKLVDPVKESTERFLDAKDAYWANSHKYRRGGRLGRR